MLALYFNLLILLKWCYLWKKCTSLFAVTENPYRPFVPDEKVKENYTEFTGLWDKNAADCGFPDKFVYETVRHYLWQYKYIIAPVRIIGK